MPKRKVKKARALSKAKTPKKGVRHHIKLGALFATKLVTAFIAFTVGIYIGKMFINPIVAIIMASAIALTVYFISVMFVLRWFKP